VVSISWRAKFTDQTDETEEGRSLREIAQQEGSYRVEVWLNPK